MASYPTSVKSFTTKLDGPGNPINAAHVNDLQDEVNAIEAGLLNGTARLNAAGSTLASLSVTGNSTVVALQAGNCTVTNLQITGASSFATRPVFVPPDAARVFLESSGAIASSAASTLAFTAQDVLTNSTIHSTSANPERLTPQSTGLYLFLAQLGHSAPTGASIVTFSIRDSSVAIIGAQSAQSLTVAGNINVSGVKRFDALGGYATCLFQNISGGSTFSYSTGIGQSWFSMVKL